MATEIAQAYEWRNMENLRANSGGCRKIFEWQSEYLLSGDEECMDGRDLPFLENPHHSGVSLTGPHYFVIKSFPQQPLHRPYVRGFRHPHLGNVNTSLEFYWTDRDETEPPPYWQDHDQAKQKGRLLFLNGEFKVGFDVEDKLILTVQEYRDSLGKFTEFPRFGEDFHEVIFNSDLPRELQERFASLRE